MAADTGARPSKPNHLAPSQLGTKEYWDALYTTELTNHASNPADKGTVWFDDSDAEAKLLAFLDRRSDEPRHEGSDDEGSDGEAGDDGPGIAPPPPPLPRATTSFLDLGCGNGSLLLALRADGWAGPMLGVDYSAQSVALARRLADAASPAGAAADPPSFEEWDVLAGPWATVLGGAGAGPAPSRPLPPAGGWDVVLDKGTFDAISLSDDRDPATGRRACEGYRGRAARLVRPGGLLLITSCNWTEAELAAWFEGPAGEGEGGDGDGDGDGDGAGRFERVGRVEYPSFSFGGVTGQTISTLCFRRA